MKKYLLLLVSVTLCLNGFAGGVKAGPWVTEARTDRVTILWTSDVLDDLHPKSWTQIEGK